MDSTDLRPDRAESLKLAWGGASGENAVELPSMPDQKPTLEYGGATPRKRRVPWWFDALIFFVVGPALALILLALIACALLAIFNVR